MTHTPSTLCSIPFTNSITITPKPVNFGPVEETDLLRPLTLVHQGRIYAVAERYMVDGLKALAMEKVRSVDFDQIE